MASPASLAQTLTKAPTLVKSVEPVFPAEAMDAGSGASVVMDIDIGVDGTVGEVKVVQSAGPAFDAAAVAAAKQLVFTPAEVDGAPREQKKNKARIRGGGQGGGAGEVGVKG